MGSRATWFLIHVGATFAVLADPTRRAILERLRAGEASVSERAEPFDRMVRTVSQRLGVLEAAGLVTRERDAPRPLDRGLQATIEPPLRPSGRAVEAAAERQAS